MILIVTNKEDIHPTPVIEHLERMGYPFFQDAQYGITVVGL